MKLFYVDLFPKERTLDINWVKFGLVLRAGAHFIELVINDNLSFTDYYHGNSAS